MWGSLSLPSRNREQPVALLAGEVASLPASPLVEGLVDDLSEAEEAERRLTPLPFLATPQSAELASLADPALQEGRSSCRGKAEFELVLGPAYLLLLRDGKYWNC